MRHSVIELIQTMYIKRRVLFIPKNALNYFVLNYLFVCNDFFEIHDAGQLLIIFNTQKRKGEVNVS